MENWKKINEIKGLENFPGYLISDIGRIKSLKQKEEKILTPYLSSNGYYRNTLFDINSKRRYFLIHHLVILAFGPEKPINTTIDHINRNPKDNSIENLRWASKEEQYKNRKKLSKIKKMELEDVLQIKKMIKEGVSKDQIAKHFNVTVRAIYYINSGKNWGHIN